MTGVDAGRRFAALVDALDGAPGVTPPGRSGRRGFGADALKVDGSIFAMVVEGQLVLKLPENRVVDLVASGAGGPFANGRGRPMREWVTVSGEDPASDLELAREALEHVRSRRR
jgi:TfoX/Sxy family transcriptional regulator of competence genes